MFTYSFFDQHTPLHTVAENLSSLMVEMQHSFLSQHPVARSEKSRPGSWSKKEILGHLVDSARYNLMRFTEIKDSAAPYSIKSYAQEHLVSMINYQYQEDEQILDLWALLNLQILEVWKRLDDADLASRILTPEGDETTLDWLIKDYVGHIRHHLDQITGP